MNPGFAVSPAAARRIAALVAEDAQAGLFRVAVNGGGCSGFQYEFGLVAEADPEDVVIERDGARVAVDPVSLPFLDGAEIDWVDELIGSSFQIRNPNAKSSCGCGVSFSV